MHLKIGLHAGHENSPYEDLRRLWRMADDSGFYWASVWDHIYAYPTVDPRGNCLEAMTILAALAAETRNVRVSCLVFCICFRNPALLAKAAVTIDHISRGRLELGLGAGWYELEHRAYGMPYPPIKVRMDMLEEGAQIIHSMLTNEETTFHGEHFHTESAYCYPRPVQNNPRLWIGGAGEKRTLRIAAKHADGWNVAYVSPEVYKHKARVLDHWCQVEGRDPAEIDHSVNLGFYMGIDDAGARRERSRFEVYFAQHADRFREGTLFGTPREVIEKVGTYVEAGVPALNITLRAPYDFDAFQSFIEDVMPAFK